MTDFVTITKSPTYKVGPSTGIKTLGTLQAEDIYATDDVRIDDDLWVKGDAKVDGTLTVGVLSPSATVYSGHLTDDIIVDAGVDLTAATGNDIFDYSLSTGVFKTSTGQHTVGGDVNVASGKDIVSLGGDAKLDFSAASGIFKTSTGAVTIGPGAIAIDGAVTIAADKNVGVTAGTTAVDLSNGTGIFKTPTGAVTIGPGAIGITGAVTIAADKNVGVTAGTTAVDLSNGTGIFKTTTGAATIGPGAIAVSGAVTLAANKGIDTTSGTAAFDFSKGTGIFKTSTGAVTIGDGAISITGAPTVATGKTLAITDADKLTVGGKIIPQKLIINVPIAAASVDQNIFIADAAYKVSSVEEAHTVAGNDASPVTAVLVKCTGTQAPSGGTACTSDTFNLKGAANTVVTGTLSGTASDYTLADGNRLALDFGGTLTTLAGGIITVMLERV
jgi:hypothetical protein